MNVSAVVLAGGKSERFGGGRDKLLAEWKGLTLIEHVLAAVTNARLGKVVTECVVAAPATATRVKSIAVGEPAQRAPTTIASYFCSISVPPYRCALTMTPRRDGRIGEVTYWAAGFVRVA